MVEHDLPNNLPIEVRCHFNGTWSPGFEIAERTSAGYRLRRVSDDSDLPGEFPTEDVRTKSSASHTH